MIDEWSDFFVATVGAAAALAGLIIVAMSVNIKTIVESPAMPSRAGVTIGSLIALVVIGAAGLIPSIDARAFGAVALVSAIGLLVLAGNSARQLFRHRSDAPAGANVVKAAVGMIEAVLFVVGGLILIAGEPATGLVVVALGFLVVFITAAINAWVLLVEVLR